MIKKFNIIKNIKIDTLFKIGIVTLASAPLVASILFLVCSFFLKDKNRVYLKDPWNLPLLISSIIMISGSIYLNLNPNSPIINNEWDRSLSFLGLFNWIPFFWFFWRFQYFLNSKEQRRCCSILFIAGTIPVLFSGFGQFWFGWEGPFELFNGLIIWYQRPLEGISGMTGMFNNPNYAGAWLSFIIPFSLAALQENKKSLLIKISSLFIFISIFIALIITYSRAAWACSIFALLFNAINIKSRKFLKLFSVISFISLTTYFLFRNTFNNLFKFILPNRILLELDQSSFENLDLMRTEIWNYALQFIFERPLLGWGSGYFPLIIDQETGFWKGHPHNLILDSFFNFGIIVGSILLIFVLTIVIRAFNKIYIKNNSNLYDRAWFTSCLLLLLSQLVDQQYHDVRISLPIWFLLCGLKNIIEDKNYNQLTIK